MVQVILMWCCVIGAFGYALYSFAKIIMQTFQKRQPGCSGSGCCGCSAKRDLLKNIKFQPYKG